MESLRQTSRRTGQAKPVSYSLIKALSGIREANYRASDAKQRFVLTARELLVLGKLIHAWKDVVGLQLAAKTCPTRLINGKLYLAVSDSPWMQTLVFLKPQILAKLNEIFPEMRTTEIIGRPGSIPPEVEKLVKEAAWPDWRNERPVPMPNLKNSELAQQLQRCQQKLDARLRGLEERGYKLCVLCRAAVTRSKDAVCAMCVYQRREDARLRARVLISEMPWLTLEEVLEFDATLQKVEYEAIREDLLQETIQLVSELATDIAIDFDEQSFIRMKKEMVRGIMLYSACMPDEVDFEHIHSIDLPDAQWLDFLAIKPGEPEC